MKQSTITYALHVLDQQFEHMLNQKSGTQRAYYDGMKTMFNILVSNGYQENIFAQYDDDGIHHIIKK